MVGVGIWGQFYAYHVKSIGHKSLQNVAISSEDENRSLSFSLGYHLELGIFLIFWRPHPPPVFGPKFLCFLVWKASPTWTNFYSCSWLNRVYLNVFPCIGFYSLSFILFILGMFIQFLILFRQIMLVVLGDKVDFLGSIAVASWLGTRRG